LNTEGLSFTEALTNRRLNLMNVTRKKFDFRAVGSMNGRIFVYIKDKRHFVDTFEDNHNLTLLNESL